MHVFACVSHTTVTKQYTNVEYRIRTQEKKEAKERTTMTIGDVVLTGKFVHSHEPRGNEILVGLGKVGEPN
jgi:hypothetical protein